MNRFALTLAIIPAFCAAALAGPKWTAASLSADISARGAAGVATDLARNKGAGWRAVAAGVATGGDDWLNIAAALHSEADASFAEALSFALAKALQKNPSGVLTRLGAPAEIEKTCDVPLIEPTDAEVAKWKKASLAALAKVNDPALKDKVDACLAALAKVN